MKSIGITYAFITFCALISMKLEIQAVSQSGDCSETENSKKVLNHFTRERSSPKKKRLPTRKKRVKTKSRSLVQDLLDQKIPNELIMHYQHQPQQSSPPANVKNKPLSNLPEQSKQKSNKAPRKHKSNEEFGLAWDSSTKLFFSAAAISCFGVIWYLIKQRVNRSHRIKLES